MKNTNLSSGVGVTELRDRMDGSGDGGIVTVTGEDLASTSCRGLGEGCLSSLCWCVGEGGGWWCRLEGASKAPWGGGTFCMFLIS